MLRAVSLAGVLALGGCVFRPIGIDFDEGVPADDLARADLTGIDAPQTDGGTDGPMGDGPMGDLADGAMPDLTDLTPPPDLTDLTPPPDLTDLTPPPDLTVANFPSHVAASYLGLSATDWTITADTTIDTSNSSAASAITPSPPAGVDYRIDNGLAVLSVRNLTIGADANATTALRVRGSRPLVIVAGQSIVVNGLLDAGGHGSTPGPAGSGSSQGSEAGDDGANAGNAGTGGAGAGYGGNGGNGGGHEGSGGPSGAGTYGNQQLTMLLGGSGGGNGNSATNPGGCTNPASGGAGGGALQLTARVSITVVARHPGGAGPGGIVNVGGGGAGGGCGGGNPGGGDPTRSGSGAAGGSGGSLLLEAPMVNVQGALGSAGGGGGAGGAHGVPLVGTVDGEAGRDALHLSDLPASSGGGTVIGGSSRGPGGAGTNSITQNGAQHNGGNGSVNGFGTGGGGGGGGGSGRIYVRSSGAATYGGTSGTTPTPFADTSLPATIAP